MGGSKTPKTPEVNYGKDIHSFVKGIKNSMPGVLGTEKKYRDDFTKLNLQDVSQFLGGKNGIGALGGQYAGTAGKQIAKAREKELRNMRGDTGLTRSLLQKLSPESAQMVEFAQQDAIAAQRNAQGLTGQEMRSAQQFAREGAADRGRVMDNSALFGEAMNRDSILGAKRAEAANATSNAYNLANSFYSAPGLQALSAVPNSYQAGQGYLGLGLGAIGSAKPQMIDIGAGLNLGAANRQNQFAANAAAAGKPSPYMSAGAGALSGAAMGSAAGPYGAAIGAVVGAGAGYLQAR